MYNKLKDFTYGQCNQIHNPKHKYTRNPIIINMKLREMKNKQIKNPSLHVQNLN